MIIEQIGQMLTGLEGKDLVVTTEKGDLIYIWDEEEQCWQVPTLMGNLLYDTEEMLDLLGAIEDEVYKIEGVA